MPKHRSGHTKVHVLKDTDLLKHERSSQDVTKDVVPAPQISGPLNEALVALSENDPRKARVVELRFFGGLTREEMAEVLGVTTRTVEREWKFAQAWLRRELTRGNREMRKEG